MLSSAHDRKRPCRKKRRFRLLHHDPLHQSAKGQSGAESDRQRDQRGNRRSLSLFRFQKTRRLSALHRAFRSVFSLPSEFLRLRFFPFIALHTAKVPPHTAFPKLHCSDHPTNSCIRSRISFTNHKAVSTHEHTVRIPIQLFCVWAAYYSFRFAFPLSTIIGSMYFSPTITSKCRCGGSDCSQGTAPI